MSIPTKINQIPLPFPDPLTLSFDCVADQIIHLAVPKDFDIVKTDMVIQGDNFAGDIFPKSLGTTVLAKKTDSDGLIEDGFIEIDQDNDMPLEKVIAIIIDFHTQRTLTGFELNEMAFPTDLTDIFCIFRIWGGGNWLLPMPKNLFWLGEIPNGSSTITVKEGLPEITAEKIFLTFARLKRMDNTYVQHDQTNGNLSALGLISIEEIALTSLNGLPVFTNDFFTNFIIQVGENSPVFQPEDEFFTYDQEFHLPDFSEEINQFLGTADPMNYDDINEIFVKFPDAIDAFDYLKNLHFSLVPLKFHTDMSGILHINELTLDYVRHQQSFQLEGETEFTPDNKTLIFERDEQRLSTIVSKVLINLADVGSINFISIKLDGGFSSDRIIPLMEIQPAISSNVDSTLGFQIIANKIAAQKIILTKPYKIKGIDLRAKFYNKKVKYTIELRSDQNNQPADEIFLSKEMEYDPQSTDEQSPVRNFSWTQVDFDEEIELSKGTYWLVLKCTEGELVWQINELTGVVLGNFRYTNENSGTVWTPLSKSYGKEIQSIYRIRHAPSDFTDPASLRIKLDDHVICELEQDSQSIDILIEKQVAIEFPDDIQIITLDFESQSIGELKVSDLIIKYKETDIKKVQINGFVQSLCFSSSEVRP